MKDYKKNTISKYRNSEWDFSGANTKTYTNCFHAYPAMMIPQIADRIIQTYGNTAKLLFDPYCGTGTSLVSANVHGINAIGTDLNPLARLVASAKTTILDIEKLDKYLKLYDEYIFQILFEDLTPRVEIPNFFNIDFWFSEEVIIKLAYIKNFIKSIKENDIKNFFWVAFSETVRDSSWTRNGEFKLYRMSKDQMAKFNPDVFSIMLNKLSRNKKGLVEFIETVKKYNVYTKIFDFNTVHEIKHIKNNTVDIVVTSPPYGDSRTTVAYGQYSRLSNQWLDIIDANHIDKQLMGGNNSVTILNLGFDLLDDLIQTLSKIDKKRAKDVFSFYYDYFRSIKNVSTLIKKDGFACYVVGNRKVKGLTLPTDEITKLFFERNGFRHIETIIREFPLKRMPKLNSPSNKQGIKDSTMNNEFIVIMQKK